MHMQISLHKIVYLQFMVVAREIANMNTLERGGTIGCIIENYNSTDKLMMAVHLLIVTSIREVTPM